MISSRPKDPREPKDPKDRRERRSRERVTFRLDPDLVEALRELPNQTAFVEGVLREALGRACPLCDGTGEVRDVHLAVSDFKNLPVPRLDRAAAAQLKTLVQLGRQLLATDLKLRASHADEPLEFSLARENELLLTGRIPRGGRNETLVN